MVSLAYKAMLLAKTQGYLNSQSTDELFQAVTKTFFIFLPYLPAHPYKLF